jgi:hypothetical protein
VFPQQTEFTHQERFLTFEPDHGGWNNIRLQFEVAIVFAHSTNRTLVLPPKKHYYLLGPGLDVGSFYDIEDLGRAMPVITAEEFLERMGLGDEYSEYDVYVDYCRKHGVNPKYVMYADVLAVPDIATCSSTIPDDFPDFDLFAASNNKKELSREEVDAQILHIRTEGSEYRTFGLWYAFFYFSNPEWHRFYVGLIRKNFHYHDWLFDIGAEIVAKIVERHGLYNAVHIRRGDFQYTETRIPAEDMLRHTAPLLKSNGVKTLFVASDEKSDSFFDPFRQDFHVIRLGEFLKEVKVEKHYFGLLDQIICSAGELFIGTELSTFSAHITRLRFNMDYEIAPDKEFYLTTRQYSGDRATDRWESSSTWMNDGSPRWPHAVYFREFFDFLNV